MINFIQAHDLFGSKGSNLKALVTLGASRYISKSIDNGVLQQQEDGEEEGEEGHKRVQKMRTLIHLQRKLSGRHRRRTSRSKKKKSLTSLHLLSANLPNISCSVWMDGLLCRLH